MTLAISTKPLPLARGGANGADWPVPIEYVDPDGLPIDCTGCTVSGEIKWAAGSLSLTVENGRVASLDLANGKWIYFVAKDDPDQARVPQGEASTLVVWIVDTLGVSLPVAIQPLKVIDL
jgi:hypothetical protein